jgi:methyl-accepting chemotaxis protein
LLDGWTNIAKGLASAVAAMLRLLSRIREFRGEWERQPHKPVTQNNMSEGEIELF